MRIDLTPARAGDHAILGELYDAYVGEVAAAGAAYRRDDGGRWQPDLLPWWLAPGDDRLALVLRDEGRPVGFAFVLRAPGPHLAEGLDLAVSELFVAPGDRGRGVGAQAVRQLLERHRGRWEVRQLEGNPRATRFWRRALGTLLGGAYAQTRDGAGPLQRFDNRVMPSRVGLGAGRIGGDDLDDAAVDRLVGTALDLGVTVIDTAPSYGRSEERLGRALGGGRRERVFLSTKVGYGVPGVPDWTGACVARGVDAALGRLGTDRLDVVYLHSCGLDVLERGDVVEALERAVQAGKVRVAGYSGENEALDWALRSGRFGAVQCSVSVVDPRPLVGALAEAGARGAGVFAKRPLGNAPWTQATRPAEDDRAEAWDRFRALGLDPAGLSWDALFARFAAHCEGVTSILVGTGRAAHLEAVVRAVAEGPLPETVRAAVRDGQARVGGGWRGRI